MKGSIGALLTCLALASFLVIGVSVALQGRLAEMTPKNEARLYWVGSALVLAVVGALIYSISSAYHAPPSWMTH